MDIKELATKVIGGASIDETIKSLDDAQKTSFYQELTSQRKAEADAEQARLVALRAEKTRLETQKNDAESDALVKVRSQIRTEQVQKARSKFVSEMGLSEDQMKSVDEAFKTEDSGKFDADLIIPDLRRAYAKANSDVLINVQKAQADQQKNAAQFNAQNASGGSFGGGTSADGKTYSPQTLEWVRAAAAQGISLTPEQAEAGLKGGTRRF